MSLLDPDLRTNITEVSNRGGFLSINGFVHEDADDIATMKAEIEELRTKLYEAEETIREIRDCLP